MARTKKLTRRKARLILSEKKVRGHPLTEKQRKFFGARASGSPVRRTKKSSVRKTKR